MSWPSRGRASRVVRGGSRSRRRDVVVFIHCTRRLIGCLVGALAGFSSRPCVRNMCTLVHTTEARVVAITRRSGTGHYATYAIELTSASSCVRGVRRRDSCARSGPRMGEERARALVVRRVVVPEARHTVVFAVDRSSRSAPVAPVARLA